MGLLYTTLALDAVAVLVCVLLHRKHPDHGFKSIALITIVGMALAAIPVGVVFWIGFGVSAFVWALMLLKTHRPILRVLTGGRVGGLDKRRAALAALDNHARRYKVSIPERLRAFYADDFQRFDGKYATADLENWGGGTFQLALTPPTWLNKDDDAVNGPRGEWTEARHHLPLFVTDQALYVVANLEQPGCPVGWYHEESYQDGPSAAAPSLDEFLSQLTEAPQSSEDVFRPADPEQDDDWREDFSDDGPRVFDVAHGD